MTNLNKYEKVVLNQVYSDSEPNGYDFCYFSDVYPNLNLLFSKNQVKGYIGSLTQKGYISVCEESKMIFFMDLGKELFGIDW